MKNHICRQLAFTSPDHLIAFKNMIGNFFERIKQVCGGIISVMTCLWRVFLFVAI